MDDNQHQQQRLHDAYGGVGENNNNNNNNNTGDLRQFFFSPYPPQSSVLTDVVPWTFTMPTGRGGGEGGGAKWARQETLTLLEVRSTLHHKFKEANHKGPLWDQVSRTMCEEHGYQRSGKKCREKFENLYKYYKKTKDGKAGRQDGKSYRFFRQLEAICGQPDLNQTRLNLSATNIAASNVNLHGHHQEGRLCSISLSTSPSELQTSTADDDNLNRVNRRGKQSWKSKIMGFIDLQMRRIVEKQEAWLEKMMKTIEHKEKERMSRDEEWRSHESQRMEREHKLWAEKRAWIEARDRVLIDSLQKLTGKEFVVEEEKYVSSSELSVLATHQGQLEKSKVIRESKNKEGDDQDRWEESEITELVRLRASMDARFEHCSRTELEVDVNLWEEIATRMASLGHVHKSATMCKEKWDLIISLLMKKTGNNKKRKDNRRIESVGCSNSSHHQHLQAGQSNHHYSYGEIDGGRSIESVPPNIGLGGGGGGNHPMSDSFRFWLGND